MPTITTPQTAKPAVVPQQAIAKPDAKAVAEHRKTFLVKILDNLLTIHHIGDNYLGIPIDKEAIDALRDLRNQIDPTTPFNGTNQPAQVGSQSINQQPNQPTTQTEPYNQYPNQFGFNEFGVQVGLQGNQSNPANFLDSFNRTQKGYQGSQTGTKPVTQPANQSGSTIRT